MGRAPCCNDHEGLKKGPWTAEEDQKLIDYVQEHGNGNWRTLPKRAGLLRCGKSCRLRWTNYLRPDIKRGTFTPEDELTIIRLHSVLGNKWSSIATHLPGRTDNEIKNYWNTKLKKKLMMMGVDPVTHRPIPSLPNMFFPPSMGDQAAIASAMAARWKTAILEAELQRLATAYTAASDPSSSYASLLFQAMNNNSHSTAPQPWMMSHMNMLSQNLNTENISCSTSQSSLHVSDFEIQQANAIHEAKFGSSSNSKVSTASSTIPSSSSKSEDWNCMPILTTNSTSSHHGESSTDQSMPASPHELQLKPDLWDQTLSNETGLNKINNDDDANSNYWMSLLNLVDDPMANTEIFDML